MGRNSRILIADDNPINQSVLEEMLYAKGYTVAMAKTGQECFDLARTIMPDMVLMDVMMPEMDGFEACELLKACDLTSSIPVIFITAMTSNATRHRAIDCGGQGLLTKPFNRKELLEVIESTLKSKGTFELAHQ